MRFFEYVKKKPKNNKTIMIQYKDYGWGSSCYLNTDIATMINNECVLNPTILNIKMSLDRIVKWSYIQ